MAEAVPSTQIGLDVPPEPDHGSIVVDRDLRAWQRTARGWTCTHAVIPMLLGLGNGPIAWSTLLLSFGPVRVVWTPAAEPRAVASTVAALEVDHAQR